MKPHRNGIDRQLDSIIAKWTEILGVFCVWIISCSNSAQAVCSLETGQNAIYWWIPEDRPAGSIIDSLPIEGNSSGNSSDIELRLVEGNQWFTLDSENKHLILKHAVDRDFGDTKLDGVVECSSLLAGDQQFKVNISVSVKVQDVNDNAPLFDAAEYHFNVTEELPPGTVVYTGIRAVDADQAGQNSEVLYGVLDDGLFTSSLLSVPNPWEGTLVVKNRIDYEQVTNFSFIVTAKDNGFPTMSSTAVVYVYVQDEDDQNPRFEYDRYTATASSDAAPGTILEIFPAQIKAIDGDTLNASLTYSLSGADAEAFEVDASSGKVSVKKALSSVENYLLTVHATQHDRPERQASVVLVVRVANKSPKRKLRFSNPTFTASISELAQLNSQVLRVTLAEEMESDSLVLFSIVNSQNETHQFRIDPEKGILRLAEPLDYEKKKEYRFRVRATDGTQKTESDVIITVENANDNSPIFNHAVYSFTLNGTANELAGVIGTVTARDNDGDRIAYSLLNVNDIFAINDLGQIRIRDTGKLANRSYETVIAATDSGNPPRVTHTIARIEILDKARFGLDSPYVSPSTSTANTTTFLVVTILAGVLFALIFIVLLLAFYVCRLRKRKRRTVSSGGRRQGDGIIVANPLGPQEGQKRSSWAQNSVGVHADRSTPTNTNSTDSSMFPIIANSPQLPHTMHDVQLSVDTNHPVEYTIPIIQPRHPGLVFRRPITDGNHDSMLSLTRADHPAPPAMKPNPWRPAKSTPALTVYF